MINLLIDTTNKYLILILEINDKVVDRVKIIGERIHTEQTNDQIDILLANNNLALSEVNNFYVVVGPGSYTGVRVGLTIVKTIKTINPKIKVYTINSLLFQAADKKVVSMLDAKSDKVYFAIYDNKNETIALQLLDNQTAVEIAEQFTDFEIIKDYENIYEIYNYLALKSSFTLIEDVNYLNPIYLKGV